MTDPAEVKRSVCAMGHKWMWNPKLGGLPPEEFLAKVDPLLAGVRAKLGGEYATSDKLAGQALARSGREAGPARGHSDSGGRVRRALGRDRRGYAAKATWSTWWARRRASSAMRHRPSWCRACAAWCREACIRHALGLRRGYRRRAIFSRRSPRRAGTDGGRVVRRARRV